MFCRQLNVSQMQAHIEGMMTEGRWSKNRASAPPSAVLIPNGHAKLPPHHQIAVRYRSASPQSPQSGNCPFSHYLFDRTSFAQVSGIFPTMAHIVCATRGFNTKNFPAPESRRERLRLAALQGCWPPFFEVVRPSLALHLDAAERIAWCRLRLLQHLRCPSEPL